MEKTSGGNTRGNVYDRLWWYIDVAVSVLATEHNGSRGGGTFHLRRQAGAPIFHERFRAPHPDKADKYGSLAAEKCSRLAKHPDHILSFQSKNDTREQYQGGVRTPNGLIGAFSGFTAEEDEVLVLWVFVKMGWMSGKEAYAAAQISRNTRYAALVQKLNKIEKQADD